jgi:hypothetical protein
MAEMTLKALLFGEDKGMSKAFKGAGESAKTAGKDVGKGTAAIKAHLGNFAKLAKGDVGGLKTELKGLLGGLSMAGPEGAAAAAGIGLTGAAMALAAEGAHQAMDTFAEVAGQVLKLQRIMGGTAEDASRLRFAFQETGIDADTAAKAIGIFSKNLVNAEASTKATTAMTKLLGESFRDAHGHIKPMSELLPGLADKFAKMPNGAEKSALALKLFGKGGLALLPFLNRGAAGIKKLKEESDKFGLTLSGKDLDALKKSKVAHKEWDAAIEGAKVRIGSVLFPMLTKLVTYLTAKMIPVIVWVGKFWKDHANTIQTTATVIGKSLVLMVKGAIAWEKGVFAVVQAVGKIFDWLWTNAIRPAVTFILGGFAMISSAIGHFLVALGHIPKFEWAKKAGDMMLSAAAAARTMADAINRIPANKTVTVNTFFKTHGTSTKPGAPNSGTGKGYASGTSNAIPGWHWVGENGPELLNLRGGESILTARQSAAAVMGGRGGGVTNVNITVTGPTIGTPDGIAREIQTALLKYKRRTGHSTLGLA